MLSRASYTILLFVDRLFLSRVGKHELAAALSGSLSSLVLTSFFVGLVGYVAALAAQYYGAGRRTMCARATIQAVYLSLASYPVLLCFVPLIRYVFVLTGQDPALAGPATLYARMLLSGSIFLLLQNALGGFFIGTGKTRIVLVSGVVRAAVNISLSYVLIFGRLGAPAMGIRGAGWSSICGSFAACLVLVVCYLRETRRADHAVQDPLRFEPDVISRLFRFGLPAAVEPFLNWFAFYMFVQIMHSYGTDTAAATTIAFNWDTVAFVPLLGLGTAATSVSGQHLGAGDVEGAQASIRLTLRVSVLYAAVMIALFVGLTRPLVSVFASGFADGDGGVAAAATVMLRLLALYTVALATKLVLGGALRAAGDTAWLMRVSIALHWAMAAATVVLVRVLKVPPFVAWTTLIAMNNLHAVSAYVRYRSGRWRAMRLIG